MKSNVTVEELNAATILLTGIPVSNLVEVHIAGSNVTAISADSEGNFIAHRVPIGTPVADEDEAETVEWFEPMDKDTVDAEVIEETIEDDGT